MSYPDDFQAQAPGSPYAPTLTNTQQGFMQTADQLDLVAARLSYLADALRQKADEGGTQGTLVQSRNWLAMLDGAADGLEFIL